MYNNNNIYSSWESLKEGLLPEYFKGTTADTYYDRKTNINDQLSIESSFIQSNARAFLGHSANGTLRFVSMPTQIFPAPTMGREFKFGSGMYYSSDILTFLGDMSYSVLLDDGRSIDLDSEGCKNTTHYMDHYLPYTTTLFDDIEITIVSIAPVAKNLESAALKTAPLPGPAGIIYTLAICNKGNKTLTGRVVLKGKKRMIGRAEDINDEFYKRFNTPELNFKENTLILSRPYGSMGIHFNQGAWTQYDDALCAERSFKLNPGMETEFESYIALGTDFLSILPTIYSLNMHTTLEWINKTSQFWQSRLGRLSVNADDYNDEAKYSLEIYIRSLFDNFNCIQTDADGNLLSHMQGVPSHRYGTVWGIDLEPTAVSILRICPELAKAVLLYFANRSKEPSDKHGLDFSVPILVAPVIIARKLLEETGDVEIFNKNPKLVISLKEIMDDLLTIKHHTETLFPTRYCSDGTPGKKYDYGTNVKVWYAYECITYILEKTQCNYDCALYKNICKGITESIYKTMVSKQAFGKQITGGTNLDGDPNGVYLSEEEKYYDGEDTSSMLAPIYGFCDFDNEEWINYHRYARTLFCNHYDPEFDSLVWTPNEPLAITGTGLVSKLGGSISKIEMAQALRHLKNLGIDDVTGSLYWWPSGYTEKRVTTKCSQGQGTWAWQYYQQWLGITVDSVKKELWFAPLGLLDTIEWKGLRNLGYDFDIRYKETEDYTEFYVKNNSQDTWCVNVGLRKLNTGAQPKNQLNKMQFTMLPGETISHKVQNTKVQQQVFVSSDVVAIEGKYLSDRDGVLFKRYGGTSFKDAVTWQRNTAPIEMRFVVLNATGYDWRNVNVTLSMPEGWKGGVRKPGHRSIKFPPSYIDDEISVDIGELKNNERTVVPFNLCRPVLLEYVRPKPYHHPSQPGTEINLFVKVLGQEVECDFTSTLTAIDSGGNLITRTLQIPFKVHNIDI